MLSRLVKAGCLAAAVGLLAAGTAPAQDTVKIGLILPMTGPFTSTGKQIDAAVPKSWPTRIRRAERVCSAYATEVYARRQRAYAAQRLGADALDAEVAEFEAWIAEQEAGELGEVLADAQRMMREMEDWTYSSGQNTDDLRLDLAMTLRSACP